MMSYMTFPLLNIDAHAILLSVLVLYHESCLLFVVVRFSVSGFGILFDGKSTFRRADR